MMGAERIQDVAAFVLDRLRQWGVQQVFGCPVTVSTGWCRRLGAVSVLVVAWSAVSSARSFAARRASCRHFRLLIIACRGYSLLVATTNAADYIPDTREL